MQAPTIFGKLLIMFSFPAALIVGVDFYLYAESSDDQKTKAEGNSKTVFIRFVRMVVLFLLD